MQRKGSGRVFGRKRHGSRGKSEDKDDENVHHRNLRLFASPVILFFNILRFLAFQLWLALSLVCRSSAHALPQKSKQAAVVGLPSPLHVVTDGEKTCLKQVTAVQEMAYTTKPAPAPGPGEPALAKQKHHHRKAFEYISKALKIDEDQSGKGRTSLLTVTGVWLGRQYSTGISTSTRHYWEKAGASYVSKLYNTGVRALNRLP